MRRLVILCIALLPAWPASAPAQTSSQLAPGARIRITASGLGSQVGTLVAISADTLVLRPDSRADMLRVPVTSVSSLEMSRGRKSRVGAGIGYGALVGVVTGAAVGALACVDCAGPSEDGGGGTAYYAVGGAVFGVVVGSVVGGIIGAAHSGERWEQVSSDRWHLSVAP